MALKIKAAPVVAATAPATVVRERELLLVSALMAKEAFFRVEKSVCLTGQAPYYNWKGKRTFLDDRAVPHLV